MASGRTASCHTTPSPALRRDGAAALAVAFQCSDSFDDTAQPLLCYRTLTFERRSMQTLPLSDTKWRSGCSPAELESHFVFPKVFTGHF